MEKLRVGVIGCGRISVRHFLSLKAIEDVELVACCDNKPERADESAKEYGIKAYYSYEEMIEKENLNAVHLCLPHYLHSKVAIYAFEHGIHVLTEKPMDVNYENAEKAVNVAKEQGLTFGVIFQCRYTEPARLVRKAVDSGKLGKILSVRSVLTWNRSDDYYSSSDWKGTWDKEGGGVVIDQAIHSIDLANWIINSDIESVSCSMHNHGHKKVNVEDTAEGLITYTSGTKYSFYCMNNYSADEPIEIRMVCENGKVTFGYHDALIVYNDGTTEEAHEEQVKKAEGGKDYWGSWHIRQIRQFYNALLGREPLEVSAEETLKIHKLIMRLYDEGGMRK